MEEAPFDAEAATTPELFAAYRSILRELRNRKIVRTANAPAGDYAEYLVARALKAELAPNSEKSYDLKTADGHRVQVKCRVDDETGKNPRRRLSPFRTFDFDQAAIVLLYPDYTVRRAVLVPRELIQASGHHNEHTNAWFVEAKTSLLDRDENEDITEALRIAAGED